MAVLKSPHLSLTPLQAMHAGVIRDYEQQRLKRERQADFEMQRELEQEYRKVQTVSDGGGPAAQHQEGGPAR
jgi:protein PET117